MEYGENEGVAMKIVTYLNSLNEIDSLDRLDEIIISPSELTRYGQFSIGDISKLNTNKKLVLEWDILMTEQVFLEKVELLKKINLDLFDSIRVQDPGALEYVLEHTNLKVQFIAESGNHNLLGLQTWVNYIGKRLDRIVLSIELPHLKLAEYVGNLDCETEIYGIGRVLLFYSPRHLISSDLKNQKVIDHPIEISASSEESPHKGFPIVQNEHGTFMFNTKDHSLLDHLDDLDQLGISHLRVDGRFFDNLLLTNKVIDLYEKKITVEDIKNIYPNRLIKGFFNSNKTDVIFNKLKNYRIQRKDINHIGEVVDAQKKKYIAVLVKSRGLKINENIKVHTPDGKVLDHKVNVIRDSKGNELKSANVGDLVFLKSINSVSVRSQVYFSY